MKPLKIAIVFENFVRAGSQRHLVEILKGLRFYRPEVEVGLFLIASPDANWNSFLPEVLEVGVPVVTLPYVYNRNDGRDTRARLHNWWSRRYRERSLNADFYDQLSRFEVVVCAQPFVADLLLPNLQPRQRLCFHLMEHLAQRSSASYDRLLQHRRLHLIYMHYSQIAQLPHLRNPNPTITWPVRLCPDHLREITTPKPDPSQILRLAHYSRISPMRLIDQVIDAFALLVQRTPASLRIAGYFEDPAYHQALLAQIEQLGLTQQVSFVDPVPSPAEDPQRHSIDLVWMISLSGHIGYAGIEAMAAGLPTLLLEVDNRASLSPLDPELSDLICSTPEALVLRSCALHVDRRAFLQQQRSLIHRRFITTKEAIDELTAFYLGQS